MVKFVVLMLVFLFNQSAQSEPPKLPSDRVIEARQALAQLGAPFSPRAFLQTIVDGDQVAFELYVQAGIDVTNLTPMPFLDTECNLEGMFKTQATPLFLATWKQRKEYIKRLLDAGANPNVPSTYCHLEGLTPLMMTAGFQDLKSTELLLAQGANVNSLDSKGQNVLNYAMNKDHDTKLAEFLIKKGADVNAGNSNYPPIQAAVHDGSTIYTKFFLAHGASLARVDDHGNSALSLALSTQSREIVQLLLDHKAPLASKSYSRYAFELVEGALRRQPERGDAKEVLQTLLKHGLDINARDRDGLTVLADSVKGGWNDRVGILLAVGADPNVPDKAGLRALDYARSERRSELVASLKQKGARATKAE